MADVDDAETKVIKQALEILLTPDGRGRKRKAIILSELACTVNANKLREHIKTLIDTDQFV